MTVNWSVDDHLKHIDEVGGLDNVGEALVAEFMNAWTSELVTQSNTWAREAVQQRKEQFLKQLEDLNLCPE